MSLDLKIYSDKDKFRLEKELQQLLDGTPFASYDDWHRTFSPGPFDQEILKEFGYDLTVASRATFRVRKENIESEMEFVRKLRDTLGKTGSVALLLNGEPFA